MVFFIIDGALLLVLLPSPVACSCCPCCSVACGFGVETLGESSLKGFSVISLQVHVHASANFNNNISLDEAVRWRSE